MYLKHKIYGKLFNLFTKFSINDKQISFILDSSESFKGNLDYIKKEFEKRGDFQFNFFYKDKLSFSSFKRLATSRYVFLNDNFFPLAFMNFKKDTKVIQLWHAPGAFKKFGASSDNKSRNILGKISRNIDYLITSSDNIEDYYSEAFQINKSKIKSLGLPRADYYFKNHNLDKLRDNFDSKYPIAKNKKIVLYAPTFRDNQHNKNTYSHSLNLDLKKVHKSLGDNYVVALRLHYLVSESLAGGLPDGVIDVSNYPDITKLYLVSDLLITDYSSVMFDFSLTNKPMYFYMYDLKEYRDILRGFYFDISELPGAILETEENLISALNDKDYEIKYRDKYQSFRNKYVYLDDGKAASRCVSLIFGRSNNGKE